MMRGIGGEVGEAEKLPGILKEARDDMEIRG